VRSEKREERSRYRVGNLRLPDLQYVEILKRRFCFAVRMTSRVCRILQTFTTFRDDNYSKYH